MEAEDSTEHARRVGTTNQIVGEGYQSGRGLRRRVVMLASSSRMLASSKVITAAAGVWTWVARSVRTFGFLQWELVKMKPWRVWGGCSGWMRRVRNLAKLLRARLVECWCEQ